MKKVMIVIDASMIIFSIVLAASQYVGDNMFSEFISFLSGALWTCFLIRDWKGRKK